MADPSTINDKLDTILRLVGPAPLWSSVVLERTEDGPLIAGATGTSTLFIPARTPAFALALEVEVVDEISFRYRFKDYTFGLNSSVPRFAQLYRVRGADG